MNLEALTRQNHARKVRTALLFGAMAGIGFAASAWGYDAVRMAQAHAIFAFLQFGLGALLLGLIGALVSYLVYRANNMALSIFGWLTAGILFARLAAPVQYQLSEAVLRALLPDLAGDLAYPLLPTITARTGIVTFFIAIIALIAGMFSITLIENSAEASSPVSSVIPLVIWLALFGLAGYSVRDNFTAPLATAITGTDRWIQFAQDAQTTPVSSEQAKQNRLRSAEPFVDVIARPRRLLLTGYNDWMTSMDVLILFGETRVTCAVVDGNVNFCKRLTP